MPRPLLPPASVRLFCPLCRQEFAELDVNTQHLASAICRARRAHAAECHPELGD